MGTVSAIFFYQHSGIVDWQGKLKRKSNRKTVPEKEAFGLALINGLAKYSQWPDMDARKMADKIGRYPCRSRQTEKS
jgi:hypothetical protein